VISAEACLECSGIGDITNNHVHKLVQCQLNPSCRQALLRPEAALKVRYNRHPQKRPQKHVIWFGAFSQRRGVTVCIASQNHHLQSLE